MQATSQIQTVKMHKLTFVSILFFFFYDLLGRECLSTVLHTGSAISKLVLVTYKATFDMGGKEAHRRLTTIMVSPIYSKQHGAFFFSFTRASKSLIIFTKILDIKQLSQFCPTSLNNVVSMSVHRTLFRQIHMNARELHLACQDMILAVKETSKKHLSCFIKVCFSFLKA